MNKGRKVPNIREDITWPIYVEFADMTGKERFSKIKRSQRLNDILDSLNAIISFVGFY